MIGFCNHKNGSRSLPDQSSVSASLHHTKAGSAIPPCSLLMITVETQNFNLISQDFYDKTVFSLDLALIPCSCGHTGCLIWHGSYTRKVILEDQILSLRISRVRCQNCGCTHAILLSSIVPYSQIPLSIHVSVARSYENGNPSVLYSADRPTLTKTISHPWPVLTAVTGGNGSGPFLPAPLPSGIW